MDDEMVNFRNWWDRNIPPIKADLEDAINHGESPILVIYYLLETTLCQVSNLYAEANITFVKALVDSISEEPLDTTP